MEQERWCAHLSGLDGLSEVPDGTRALVRPPVRSRHAMDNTMNKNPVPLEHGRIYHIYNRGVNREPIFHGRDTYRHFLNLYVKHVGWLVDTYAYCLLGNHFHFLTRVKTLDELAEDLTGGRSEAPDGTIALSRPPVRSGLSPSRRFSNLFNAYARAFNIRYGRTGALFQRPFGRNPVTDDAYFAYLVVYIHQNPQKHGFVDDFRDWPYSSYHALAGEGQTRLDRATLLDWMGGPSGFHMAHQQDFSSHEDPSGL